MINKMTNNLEILNEIELGHLITGNRQFFSRRPNCFKDFQDAIIHGVVFSYISQSYICDDRTFVQVTDSEIIEYLATELDIRIDLDYCHKIRSLYMDYIAEPGVIDEHVRLKYRYGFQ